MYYTNWVGGTVINGVNGVVSNVVILAPPSPICGVCNEAPPIARDQKSGVLYCQACLEDVQRQGAIANAKAWLEAAFLAVAKPQRARLYRSLSMVFHPDAGGDAALMIVLNDVKDRLA